VSDKLIGIYIIIAVINVFQVELQLAAFMAIPR